MRPARGSYPCGRDGCDFVAISPGQLGGHRTTHHPPELAVPRLSAPQRALLDEIREAGVLYVRRYGRYYRTVAALVQKGYATVVEPDYSRVGQDGYSVTERGSNPQVAGDNNASQEGER